MSLLAYRKAKYRLRRLSQQIGGRLKRQIFAGLAALVHACLFASMLGVRIENYVFDSWFRVRGPIPPPGNFVIVALDRESAMELGISTLAPWPRRYQADLLDALREKGAKRVIFDIFFLAKGADEQEDRRFADALAKSDAMIGSFEESRTVIGDDGQPVRMTQSRTPLDLFVRGAKKVIPMDLFVGRDNDQVVRHISDFSGDLEIRVPLAGALGDILGPDFAGPGSDDLINYYGPSGHFPIVPFSEALHGAPPELFSGKVVFVGRHLPASYLRAEQNDTFRIPYPGKLMDGVEIHATIASNLLQRSWIRRLPASLEGAADAIFVVLMSLALLSIRISRSAFLLIAVQLGWLCIAYRAFLSGYYLPGATVVLVILPLVFCGAVFFTAMNLYRSFRDVEKAMGIRLKTP